MTTLRFLLKAVREAPSLWLTSLFTPKKPMHKLLVGIPYGKSKIAKAHCLYDKAGYNIVTELELKKRVATYKEMSYETAERLVRVYYD